MFVGIANPRAYYFSPTSPKAMELFMGMKMNASIETMKEAMTYNNATVAYFIIEKPRLCEEEYNRIVAQAEQNKLQTYKTFYYPEGEEKLHIFIYQK